MKRALMMGLASVTLAATLTAVTARSRPPEPVTTADSLSPSEILARVTKHGLDPIGQPVRRGPYYVLHAHDPRGSELRVVADRQLGDIVSVVPVGPVNVVYSSSPRIIHVPQPGEDSDRARLLDRDEPAAAPNDDNDEEIAPPPLRQIAPRPQTRSSKPAAPRRKPFAKATTSTPAPVERRTVLSVPPPPAEGPTPVRPTPRFSAKADSGEKFPPPPPAGYTPPAGLPQADAHDAAP